MEAWGEKHGYTLQRCVSCGALFALDPASAGPAAYAYDAYYAQAQFQTPDPVRLSLERLVTSAERFRTTGRWLDFGYGEGCLLSAVESRGWRCYGTEVSPLALAHGDRRGWVVTREASRDPRFPPGEFDVVTMTEFLEHVPAPRRFLVEAAGWLRPGGLLYVTTPNARSLNRWILGPAWSIVCPPEHLTLWSPAGLARALRSSGLRPSRLRTEGFNPVEILSRVRRREGRPLAAADRNQAAFALNAALSASPSRRGLKRAINAGLSLLRIGDTLKAWALRA